MLCAWGRKRVPAPSSLLPAPQISVCVACGRCQGRRSQSRSAAEAQEARVPESLRAPHFGAAPHSAPGLSPCPSRAELPVSPPRCKPAGASCCSPGTGSGVRLARRSGWGEPAGPTCEQPPVQTLSSHGQHPEPPHRDEGWAARGARHSPFLSASVAGQGNHWTSGSVQEALAE